MATEGTKPPTRQQRQICWKLRDEYFACLDRLNIIDPVTVEKNPDLAKDCLTHKKKYEDACMASWIEYFNKRRVLDVKQREYLEFSKRQSGKQP